RDRPLHARRDVARRLLQRSRLLLHVRPEVLLDELLLEGRRVQQASPRPGKERLFGLSRKAGHPEVEDKMERRASPLVFLCRPKAKSSQRGPTRNPLRPPRPSRRSLRFKILGLAPDHLNSATPSHTNCTAIARIKNPKIRLMAPTALGPRRATSGPPNRKNRQTVTASAATPTTMPRYAVQLSTCAASPITTPIDPGQE